MWILVASLAAAQEPEVPAPEAPSVPEAPPVPEVPASVLEAPEPVVEARGVDTPVRVVVRDPDNKPVSTAVIRHPKEMDRHRVNSVDGSWEASVLYLPDGAELHFTPGLELELEISAPGFMTQVLRYEVRKRRNVVEVTLPAIVLEVGAIEEPAIGFGRDEPREPGSDP